MMMSNTFLKQSRPNHLRHVLCCIYIAIQLSYVTSFVTTSISNHNIQRRNFPTTNQSPLSSHPTIILFSLKKPDDDNSSDKVREEAWDANVDYDAEWPTIENESSFSTDDNNLSKTSIPDPKTGWDALPNLPEDFNIEKLGIDINLGPLSEKESQQLKQDASKIIQKAIDSGIEDIELMRQKMNKEIQASKLAMQMASELNAKQQQEQLLNKIDKITNDFLSSTAGTRSSTKLAAQANRAMENTGRGLEMGTWGIVDGKTVLADGSVEGGISLLGSVANANKQDQKSMASTTFTTTTAMPQENRIILIADTKQDPLAKQLVPSLIEQFQEAFQSDDSNSAAIPNLRIDVLSPTSTMPLGGNNAACVMIFCTSLSQASSLNNMLDRLLRKTLQSATTTFSSNGDGNAVGTPPTQLVGISTVGTERFDKMPYSMANILSGGKYKTRRQVEEVLINTVKNRNTVPSLDYTIIKLNGDKFINDNDGGGKPFTVAPGDKLDDPTGIDTAVQTIIQAVAYQPTARNATLSLSGVIPKGSSLDFDAWQEAFLCLDGPELWRSIVVTLMDSKGTIQQYYDELREYIKEWADLLAESGKGLTTPIRSEHGLLQNGRKKMPQPRTIQSQDGATLLFLPTNTGKNYMSRQEEVRREQGQRGANKGSTSSSSTTSSQPQFRRQVQEGGIEVMVEIVDTPEESQSIRVRARRCNYADDAVIKELSEATIRKRLQEAIEVWKKDQKLK